MTATLTIPNAAAREPVFRLTVEQYHGMIDAGILDSGDPVELLDGLLVNKASKNSNRRIATHLAAKALRTAIPPGWYVDTQEPLTLSTSEPEPMSP